MNAFANLARWDPFREMQRAQGQFNRVLGNDFLVRGDSGLSAWAPEVDVRETEEELRSKPICPESRRRTWTSGWKGTC